ncbi:hypothetical protein LTR97_005250 [Elasticomyces elasticus]|uniref:Mitochondrial inner membrane protease subunit n=1 Tax=Elasticomyces elasticus TaxID=574655 RepID=A0AAN7W806_9PEZI|nr:hypothetical protein LTR97_005250 [Elasticomyces elasticus]
MNEPWGRDDRWKPFSVPSDFLKAVARIRRWSCLPSLMRVRVLLLRYTSAGSSQSSVSFGIRILAVDAAASDHECNVRPTLSYLWSTLSISLWSCATVITVNDNLFEVSFITGQSMSPSLSPDHNTTGRRDLVFWNKWVSHSGSVSKGDVILFRSPTKPDSHAVKRVVATEGDRVTLDARRRPERLRDGEDLPESRGWDAMKAQSDEHQGLLIPEGHLWVEGDYWRKSQDSNAYGPMSRSLVLGKAVAVVWPPNRFGTKPWEEYTTKTRVLEGKIVKKGDEAGLVEAIIRG